MTTTELAKKPYGELTLAEALSDARTKEQLKAAIPTGITPQMMTRVVLTMVRTNPKIAQCTRDSVLSCMMQSAQLGLLPGGAMGHAYFVPYKSECTLILGYKGLIDLARRSGQIVSISSRVVYENDEFEFAYGLEDKLSHTPAKGERGEPVYVYAVAKLVGGGHAFEVMTVDDINKIRDQSQAYRYAEKGRKDSTWHLFWGEMARKTTIRRLFKYLPASIIPPEAYEALQVEDDRTYRDAKPVEVSEIDPAKLSAGDSAEHEGYEPDEQKSQAAKVKELVNSGKSEAKKSPKKKAEELNEVKAMIFKLIEEIDDFGITDQTMMDHGLTEKQVKDATKLEEIEPLAKALLKDAAATQATG